MLTLLLGLGASRSPVSQVPNGILGQEKEVSPQIHLVLSM